MGLARAYPSDYESGMSSNERWVAVPGHEGSYEVSDMGRVRSLDHVAQTSRGGKRVKGRVLSPGKITGGYVAVTIRRKTCPVHSMVLTAFVGPRPEGYDTCHGNGVRDDNRLVNLRWGTKTENSADRRAHGTMFAGETSPVAVLTDAQAIGARLRVAAGEHIRDVAASFGMTYSGMSKVIQGESFGHLPTAGRGRHGNATLAAEDVAAIRAAPPGTRDADMARRFGVTQATVRRARLGMAWGRELPPAPPVDVERAPHFRAKLSDEQVRDLRARFEAGETRQSLVARFGITSSTVRKVARREVYAHVT